MEKNLELYPSIITLDKSIKINEQIRNCICKIYINDGGNGTGFFCYIIDNKNNVQIPVMITNNHIIGESDLKNNKKIKISFNNEKEFKDIELDSNRKKYTNENLDITIIEIRKEKDNINKKSFLEIDEKIYQNESEVIFQKKPVYVIQYPKELNASVSYGIINEINENTNELKHYCNTLKGSSGSPIINLENNKVVGVHKGYSETYNKGTYLKFPINEFLSNKKKESYIKKEIKEEKISTNIGYKNEIKITLKIEETDINKEIYFLDNTIGTLEKNIKKDPHSYLSELNHKNTDLFIDNVKHKYQKFFKPTKEGKYEVKLNFKIYMTDCSYMFFYCRNITEIDFSSFKTNNVKDMNNMFCYCSNLKVLDLSYFNTEKVQNMSNMFSFCTNLKNVILSSFNVQNVNSMENMFSYCKQINYMDISSFIASPNLKNNNMFLQCWGLKQLKLNKNSKGKFTPELDDIKIIFD